ncbi:MAG: TIGR02453 family protein [Gammaproteobacteria bacterium]|nr:TIGR02453 family protein [Gammaproteobacteria bacterium]MDH3767765.1 TIGR02453 family protein [Gammaproteobacteria bacterium]
MPSPFKPGLVGFLQDLRDNNNRDWFAENKARYESEVMNPALAFITSMADRLPGFAPRFNAVAKRQGGSLMRVYRDVRFSRNKEPYKTNVGIQFRHEAGRDVHAPGYYFHIDPDSVFIAAGIWHPDRDALAGIRDGIVEHPRQWRNARDDKAFRKNFSLAGSALKRPPRGYDPEHAMIDDLKRKDFIAVCNLKHADLYKHTILNRVERNFASARPLMRFLCKATGVRF